MNPNASNLHHMLGVTPVAGMGYVGGVGAGHSQGAMGALSGEADVMMISGFASDPLNAGQSPEIPTPTLWGQLQQPITIGSTTLPLYGWLLVAALLGGAGGYYFGRR